MGCLKVVTPEGTSNRLSQGCLVRLLSESWVHCPEILTEPEAGLGKFYRNLGASGLGEGANQSSLAKALTHTGAPWIPSFRPSSLTSPTSRETLQKTAPGFSFPPSESLFVK